MSEVTLIELLSILIRLNLTHISIISSKFKLIHLNLTKESNHFN